MITITNKVALLFLILFTALTLTASTAFAQGNTPGWGSNNNTGPGGQSVRPINNTTNININLAPGARIRELIVYVYNIFN